MYTSSIKALMIYGSCKKIKLPNNKKILFLPGREKTLYYFNEQCKWIWVNKEV